MTVKDTAIRLVEAYYDGRDEKIDNAPDLRECIEMLIELERIEQQACGMMERISMLEREKKLREAEEAAIVEKLPETATAGADVPEAPEPEKPVEKEAESADATFQGKGASEKREIFERLKAYRAERGLGCLKKLATASNGILDEDQIRNMLDGQKETLQNWKILGAALDYEERKNE